MNASSFASPIRTAGVVASCLAACLSACDCEGVGLGALEGDLLLAPAELEVVAWVGYDVRVSLTMENGGAGALDVSDVDIDIAGGALAPSDVAIELATLRLAPGQRAPVAVVVRAREAGATTLVLRATSVRGDAAAATLRVEAREPPPCVPASNCETAVFDVASGACVRAARGDGEPCDDESACTDADRCSAGQCVGVARVCDDSLTCTVDSCEPATGCVFVPVSERCADGDACTFDVCDPTLAGRAPGDGCRNPTAPDGTPCGPLSCASLSLCALGGCFTTPTPDGFPCEDGDLCTSGDACLQQECAAGDAVEPEASPPVLLARPEIEVAPEARWFMRTSGDDGPPPPPLVVRPGFGRVLDVTQELVDGVRPTLAVAWVSAPFDVDGGPCDPTNLDVLAPPGVPAFCASALFVTFVDEQELEAAAGSGAAAGDTLLLQVAYGTVDAQFADDAPTLAIVESTYRPGDEQGGEARRELRESLRFLSLASRTAPVVLLYVPRELRPFPLLERQVQARVSVAVDDELATSVFGFDVTQPGALLGTGEEGEPPTDDGPAFTFLSLLNAPNEEGVADWHALFADTCDASDAALSGAWHDLHAARGDGRWHAVVRHPELDGSACAGDGLDIAPLPVTGITHTPGDSIVFTSFAAAWRVSLTDDASLLAAVVTDTPCELPAAQCPATLTFAPSPFDAFDPIATFRRATLQTQVANLRRVAALDPGAGRVGAVTLEFAPGLGVIMRLVDDAPLDDGDAPGLELVSEPLVDGARRELEAYRSPLAPQRVYAMTTAPGAGEDEGVMVRFGCAFPTLPGSP